MRVAAGIGDIDAIKPDFLAFAFIMSRTSRKSGFGEPGVSWRAIFAPSVSAA